MPVTNFQAELLRALAGNRSEDSYLAGGTALHLQPNTRRYSNDLDFFHDSETRVADAFAADRETLKELGCSVTTDLNQPGYIRAIVSRDDDATKIEWAHDSAWRFMPTVEDRAVGFRLHDVDLAINKLLALVGRDEPRDFLDIIDVHERILPLGPLCWAASGKDPGYTPLGILELLRRRGRYRPEDFARLALQNPVDLVALKSTWLSALDSAAKFIASRPPVEIGCLYYSPSRNTFVVPAVGDDSIPHYGRPAGVLPDASRA